MDERVTRRTYALSVASLGTVGLAGCSGSDDDQQSAATTGSTPENQSTADSDQPTTETDSERIEEEFPSLSADDPAYRDWIPATGELSGAFDAAFNFSRLRESKAQLPAETYERIAGWAMFGGYIGMEYEEMEGFLAGISVGAVVYLGSVTPSTVADRLEQTRFERFDRQNDVTYYRETVQEQPTLLGVGTEGISYGGGGANDPEQVSQEFIDTTATLFETARGERSRLHEESELYRRYTDSIGWPQSVTVRPPLTQPAQGQLGGNRSIPAQGALSEETVSDIRFGRGQYLAEQSLVDVYWLTLADDADTTLPDIRDRYRETAVRSQLDDEQRLAARLDGSALNVAVVTPIENPGGGADPHLVELDVSIEGGTATISHVAGDPLALENVVVVAEAEETDPGSGVLSAGESITVEVGDVDQVSVVYKAPSGSSTSLLGRS